MHAIAFFYAARWDGENGIGDGRPIGSSYHREDLLFYGRLWTQGAKSVLSIGKENSPCTWAVVPAAGRGVRFGGGQAKQFARLGEETVLARTLRALQALPELAGIVLAVAPDQFEVAQTLVAAVCTEVKWKLVTGGKQRTDSVRAGFDALPENCQVVMVHDGVRPRVSRELLTRVLAGTVEHGACIPVLPVVDTVKELSHEGRVLRTLDREPLCRVQTPQGFRREVLAEAYQQVDSWTEPASFTDDAALVEATGQQVATVAGDPDNIKITYREDLRSFESVVPRVGFGHDVHRLVPERRLILGGVEIPHSHGLDGHSDADVLTHALMDAILGAAGAADIGVQFPPDDPGYAGADSLELLAQVIDKVRKLGWQVSSVDLTMVAQQPRLAPFLTKMKAALAGVLAIQTTAIGIKATTEEGLGFTGRAEGMAAQAVAVLVPWVDQA